MTYFNKSQESLIIDKENWQSTFLSIDGIRYLNKYKRSELNNILTKNSEHIVASINNLRSSISKNALILIKEVLKETNPSN